MKNALSILLFFLIVALVTFLYINTGNVVQEEVLENSEKSLVENNTSTPVEEKRVPEEKEELSVPDKIIEVAKASIGLPYKQGGTTKKGFDCSGLVMTSFAKEGVFLPRASYEMVNEGTDVDLKNIKRGDLVFFKTNPNRPNKVSHVGLVTSVDDGTVYFIHSTNKKGVIISNTKEDYYKRTFFKAKRVL